MTTLSWRAFVSLKRPRDDCFGRTLSLELETIFDAQKCIQFQNDSPLPPPHKTFFACVGSFKKQKAKETRALVAGVPQTPSPPPTAREDALRVAGDGTTTEDDEMILMTMMCTEEGPPPSKREREEEETRVERDTTTTRPQGEEEEDAAEEDAEGENREERIHRTTEMSATPDASTRSEGVAFFERGETAGEGTLRRRRVGTIVPCTTIDGQ